MVKTASNIFPRSFFYCCNEIMGFCSSLVEEKSDRRK